MKHPPLTPEQIQGLQDLLIRRIAYVYGLDSDAKFDGFLTDDQWGTLCCRFANAVVTPRGRWRLNDALWYADNVVARIVRRRARRG